MLPARAELGKSKSFWDHFRKSATVPPPIWHKSDEWEEFLAHVEVAEKMRPSSSAATKPKRTLLANRVRSIVRLPLILRTEAQISVRNSERHGASRPFRTSTGG